MGITTPFGGGTSGGSGTQVDFVSQLSDIPSSPNAGDLIRFAADLSGLPSGFKDSDGTTDVSSADDGEWFERVESNWVKRDEPPSMAMIEYASNAETIAGAVNNKAVPPTGVKAWGDQRGGTVREDDLGRLGRGWAFNQSNLSVDLNRNLSGLWQFLSSSDANVAPAAANVSSIDKIRLGVHMAHNYPSYNFNWNAESELARLVTNSIIKVYPILANNSRDNNNYFTLTLQAAPVFATGLHMLMPSRHATIDVSAAVTGTPTAAHGYWQIEFDESNPNIEIAPGLIQWQRIRDAALDVTPPISETIDPATRVMVATAIAQNRMTVGAGLPSASVSGELRMITAAATLESYILKLTRTGESSALDFTANDVRLSGTFYLAATGTDRSTLDGLQSGDKIILHPATGTDVVLTLSASPGLVTLNSVPAVDLQSGQYAISGSITDETSYTVYAIKSRSENAGSVFQSDGEQWQRILNVSQAMSFVIDTLASAVPTTLDALALADVSANGNPNRKALISQILGLGRASDSEWNAGTLTTKSPNIPQARNLALAQAPALAFWDGSQNPTGDVVSITVNNGGSGYSSDPTVTIQGGGGSGATATAVRTGNAVTSIDMTTHGHGYTGVPSVTIQGGGGSGASATAVIGVPDPVNRMTALSTPETNAYDRANRRWVLNYNGRTPHANSLFVENAFVDHQKMAYIVDLETNAVSGGDGGGAVNIALGFNSGETLNPAWPGMGANGIYVWMNRYYGLGSGDANYKKLFFYVATNDLVYGASLGNQASVVGTDFYYLKTDAPNTAYSLRNGATTKVGGHVNSQIFIPETDDRFQFEFITAGSQIRIQVNNVLYAVIELAVPLPATFGPRIYVFADAGSNPTGRRSYFYDFGVGNASPIRMFSDYLYSPTQAHSFDPFNNILQVAGAISKVANSTNHTVTVRSPRRTIGTTFPTSPAPVANDTHRIRANQSLETFAAKTTLTGETSTTVSDYGAGEVNVGQNNVFYMAIPAGATRNAFVALQNGGGRIYLKAPSGGTDVIVTPSGAIGTATHNSVDSITIASANYSISGTLADGASYEVYALVTRTEIKGSEFEYDGNFWDLVYQAENGILMDSQASVSGNSDRNMDSGVKFSLYKMVIVTADYQQSGENTEQRFCVFNPATLGNNEDVEMVSQGSSGTKIYFRKIDDDSYQFTATMATVRVVGIP